jgi:methionyl-tRNA synthetase
LSTCIILKDIGILLQPLLPNSAATILDMLGVDPQKRQIGDRDWRWEKGAMLPEPSPLFVKIFPTP